MGAAKEANVAKIAYGCNGTAGNGGLDWVIETGTPSLPFRVRFIGETQGRKFSHGGRVRRTSRAFSFATLERALDLAEAAAHQITGETPRSFDATTHEPIL